MNRCSRVLGWEGAWHALNAIRKPVWSWSKRKQRDTWGWGGPRTAGTEPEGRRQKFWLAIQSSGKKVAWLCLSKTFLGDLIYSCFYFVGMGVLPTCMSMHHLCAMSKEARRGHQIPWSWSCRWLSATMWVLGIESLSSLQPQACLSNSSFSKTCISNMMATVPAW